ERLLLPRPGARPRHPPRRPAVAVRPADASRLAAPTLRAGPSPVPASSAHAGPPRHTPREEDEKRIDPGLCLGVLSPPTAHDPARRTATPDRRSPGMNRTTLAAAALLFCGATASADQISWSYAWDSTPQGISANAPGSGTIFLLDPQPGTGTGP